MPLTSISSYRFARSDTVVLDTNVLIYVFASHYVIDPVHTGRGAPYTQAYKELLVKGSGIVMLDIVVSEFFKVLESMASKHWHQVGGGRNMRLGSDWEELKQFRRGGPHQTLMKDFGQAMKDVLKHGEYARVDLASGSLGPIQNDLAEKRIDFNDVLIARHCEAGERILLTSDGDLAQFQDRVEIVHGA